MLVQESPTATRRGTRSAEWGRQGRRGSRRQVKAGDGKASGKDGKPGGGSKGEKGSGKGEKGKGGSGKKSDQSGGNEKGGGKGKGDESEAKKDQENRDDEGGGDRDEEQEADGDTNDRDRSRDSQSTPQVGAAVEKIVGVLKWIVFALVAILVVVVVVLAVLRYLAPFTGWAQRLLDAIRNWWERLWGRRKATVAKTQEAALLAGPQRPPPFHEYSNPFADGSADRRDPAELVAYTFEALDAWAWDRGCGRQLPETPLEFLAHLADQFPDLFEPLTEFAKVYTRATYSAEPPPPETHATLEAMWESMVHGVGVAAG